ncbi:MAG: HAD family phosphatase [Prochloraceae cyanobacterium]|nr:HAD family phosphatase [Prochloraceae cyanobacterium]
MGLKAILFDFNGTIVNDESIHQELINEIVLAANLRPPDTEEYQQICLGRSDRTCIKNLLSRRGRVISEEYLNNTIRSKAKAYQTKLAALEALPIYPEVKETMAKIREAGLKIAVVSGSLKTEIELILDRADLKQYVDAIVAGEDLAASEPEPNRYLLAVDLLDKTDPSLKLKPYNCLAIDDSEAGIEMAKNAGMQVLGVANTYPMHMLQRQANWAVDYLSELELDRIKDVFDGRI